MHQPTVSPKPTFSLAWVCITVLLKQEIFNLTSTRVWMPACQSILFKRKTTLWVNLAGLRQVLGYKRAKRKAQYFQRAPRPLRKKRWLISPESSLLLSGSQHAVGEQEEYNLNPLSVLCIWAHYLLIHGSVRRHSQYLLWRIPPLFCESRGELTPSSCICLGSICLSN